MKRFTVRTVEEGVYQFINSEGFYLASGTSGGLMLREMPEDESLTYWTLESANGGWYVVNVGATGHVGIEYDSGRFTAYRLSPSGLYTFNFYELQQDPG